MIFSILVDAVVRAVLAVVCEPQEAHHRVVWAAGESKLVLFADDGRIAGKDHIWVQDALTMRVEIFRRVGLETNL